MPGPYRLLTAVAAALVLGGGVGALAPMLRDEHRDPVWVETQWPFANDPWGRGKAFVCRAGDCGAEIHVYVRPKLGACNCVTGIADDEDLDRMGDVALMGEATPLGEGRAVSVGWMTGRARAYAPSAATGGQVLSVAFNDRCDMIAATALLPRNAPARAEREVLALLNSAPVLDWAKRAIGI